MLASSHLEQKQFESLFGKNKLNIVFGKRAAVSAEANASSQTKINNKMRAAIIQKQKVVQEIQTNLHSSKAIIFYNFHHIDNEKLFALKRELKKVGGY